MNGLSQYPAERTFVLLGIYSIKSKSYTQQRSQETNKNKERRQCAIGYGKQFQKEKSIAEEFDTLEKYWDEYDFFYLHVKKTDSHGEDGNFEKKKAVIEELDELIPRLRNLHPDVIVVTGDHSTPSKLKMHSWHPVPVCLWSAFCRRDDVKSFGERAFMKGGLGTHFPAEDIMVLALANANRLEKFGA